MLTRKRRRAAVCVGTGPCLEFAERSARAYVRDNAKIQAVSCGKPTTMTGVIQGAAAITGTGC